MNARREINRCPKDDGVSAEYHLRSRCTRCKKPGAKEQRSDDSEATIEYSLSLAVRHGCRGVPRGVLAGAFVSNAKSNWGP